MSLFEAGRRGGDWSVLTDGHGHLAEAPGSNIFVVKDGVISTPIDWCLEGITRQTTIELCRELGIEIDLRKVRVEELIDADEAFYTSSAGGIMPINSVDSKVLGGVSGPGPITTYLHNLYWERRWSGWLGTPVDYTKT